MANPSHGSTARSPPCGNSHAGSEPVVSARRLFIGPSGRPLTAVAGSRASRGPNYSCTDMKVASGSVIRTETVRSRPGIDSIARAWRKAEFAGQAGHAHPGSYQRGVRRQRCRVRSQTAVAQPTFVPVRCRISGYLRTIALNGHGADCLERHTDDRVSRYCGPARSFGRSLGRSLGSADRSPSASTQSSGTRPRAACTTQQRLTLT